MPYLPEEIYADMRRLYMFRDQLTEDRIRNINRLHREMKIYFPEYADAFGKLEGAFALEILCVAPMPSDIIALGVDGLRNIWHEAKLRGRGYSRANDIVNYAKTSVGLKDGTDAGREAIRWFVKQIQSLAEPVINPQAGQGSGKVTRKRWSLLRNCISTTTRQSKCWYSVH